LVFSWAFYRAFRISELVCENKQGIWGLQAGDVWESSEWLTIMIRDFKTEKEGRGLAITLFRAEGCRTCPVTCYSFYKAIRPKGKGGYLIHQNSTTLSCFQFISLFKRAVHGLGLSVKEYGSHSFRIVATTEAVRWGLGPEEVRRIGRWCENQAT
ncbi:hypothetical protein XELAEV_18029852mg, partial [Xenopus laevis]